MMCYLRFLQPQVAVTGEIASIITFLENLPIIIQSEFHRELKLQWQQMGMGREIPYMVAGPSDESIKVIQFLINIGKNEDSHS